MSTLEPLAIRYGRSVCGDPVRSASLEWLVTNGIGGYASGTVAGIRTRRYHGLLVAALDPPAARTVMVAELHENVAAGDGEVPLHASRWNDGSTSPRGFEYLEAFWLEGSTPTWRFAVGDLCLEKRVMMVRERNVTIVAYRVVRAQTPVRLTVKVLAVNRDFHSTMQAGHDALRVAQGTGGITVSSAWGGPPLRVGSPQMSLVASDTWYHGFALDLERERGLDYLEDALHVATATVQLGLGEQAELVLSADADSVDPAAALAEVARHERTVIAEFAAKQGERADATGARLALSADQFLVRRPVDGRQCAGIIAGYHWFGDWGRDTMISVPGLTLATGRATVARDILVTYAQFVDRGMLPNRFPDAGGPAEYNTVDATLWYFEAIRAYVEVTNDLALVDELWPVLEGIIAAHEVGTRHGIRVDAQDGLLRSGEPGVQLTWMDAKVGDWVVTPREGKCVEINALWYNGLVTMTNLAAAHGRDVTLWRVRAERVRLGMQRFWREDAGHLADVLDGPFGDDLSLRPNQVFAVSLAASAFNRAQQHAIVDACARALVTSHGLRSLAPEHPDYRASYDGDQLSRDGAYHQGTVWAWLLGPFALAHYRVHGVAADARVYLDPLVDHLLAYGVGSVAEIFDATPPHRPRGCVAQAWSVADLLQAWTTLRQHEVGHEPRSSG